MLVKEVLAAKGTTVETAAPDLDVREALHRMVQKEIGSLVVVQDGKVLGIISERDILRACDRIGALPRDLPVREFMTENIVIGLPEDTLDYVMAIMTKNRIRHLPVLDGETLIGLISIGDVVKHRLKEEEANNRYLMDYISGKYM